MIEILFFQAVLKMQEELKKMPEQEGQAFLQQCLQSHAQAFDDNDWFYLELLALALSEAKKSCSADFSVSLRSALSMYLLKEITSSDEVVDNS